MSLIPVALAVLRFARASCRVAGRFRRAMLMLGAAGVVVGGMLLVATPVQAAAASVTTTTLATSPNPVTQGAIVTLTATVTAADGTTPTGSVQFQADATDIGGPVAVNSDGVAVTTTRFSTSAVMSLSATFSPLSSAAYAPSTGTHTEIVTQSAGTIPVQVGVPIPVIVTVPPTGSFTVRIPAATAVLVRNSANTQATGSLGTITVSDSRNYYPGFAVYGQEMSNFAGSGLPAGVSITSIPSDNLGWQPTGTVQGGATVGPGVADIGAAADPAVLVQALAGAGFGTDTLDPALTLTLPADTPAGTFTGAVTITYITVAP